jgi:chromosome segregation ATPase
MPKLLDDEGKEIPFDLDALLKAAPDLAKAISAQVGAKVEATIEGRLDRERRRLKSEQQPDPEAAKALEAAQARVQALEDEKKTDLEKLTGHNTKLAEQLKAANEALTKAQADFQARYNARLTREAAMDFAAKFKVPPANVSRFVNEAATLLVVGKNDEVFAEDPDTGRKIEPRARFEQFRALPENAIFNPPPASGTGDRTQGTPAKPEVKNWRNDPAALKRAAAEEFAKMRDRPVSEPALAAPPAVAPHSGDGS